VRAAQVLYVLDLVAYPVVTTRLPFTCHIDCVLPVQLLTPTILYDRATYITATESDTLQAL
jgi:hypothetical protein